MIAYDTTPQRAPFRGPFSTIAGGLLWGLLMIGAPAWAHISEDGLRHEIVVKESLSGTTIWVRVPLPVVFGDIIADAARTGAPLAAEMLTLEQTGYAARYRVDMAAVATSEARFIDRLQQALQVSRGDKLLQPTVTNWRITARWSGNPFDSPVAARAALRLPSTGLDPVFGQSIVAYEMHLPGGSDRLSLQTGTTPLVLPQSVDFDTQISRHAAGEPPVKIILVGQLKEPVSLPPPIWQGVVHKVKTFAGPTFVILGSLILMIAVIRPLTAKRRLRAVRRRQRQWCMEPPNKNKAHRSTSLNSDHHGLGRSD